MHDHIKLDENKLQILDLGGGGGLYVKIDKKSVRIWIFVIR